MREQPNYQQALEAYTRLMKRTAYFTAVVGRSALKPVVWGLELPAQLRPHIRDRLRAELPRSEAKIALDAILRGRAHQDRQLIGQGEVMLVKAVQTATTSKLVPGDVTEEVVQIAHDVHLDPENTPTDPFVARHVKDVLEEFGEEHS